MDLLEWLFIRQRFGIKASLDRITKLLNELGNPQLEFQSILIGGTNGKGSTAASLASIVKSSGRKTALFTSPHLSYFAERFRVNDEQISEELIYETLIEIKPHAEACEATFFEIVTALGCVLFANQKVEIAIMEVGMGGRFDATNALEPEMSIITNIALDHMAYLGSTKAAIAFEKAGIMRSHKAVFTAATGEALEVLIEQAELKQAKLVRLGTDIDVKTLKHDWSGNRLEIKTQQKTYKVQTPLIGKHQAENVALAVSAAAALGIKEDAINKGIKTSSWPGRLELIKFKGQDFLLDGAHNPAAALALRETLDDIGVVELVLIYGSNKYKDVKETLAPLIGLSSNIIFSQAALSPKATPAKTLYQRFQEVFPEQSKKVQLSYKSKINEAIQEASKLKNNQLIVIMGSLYLVGEARPILLNKTNETRERYQ